MSINDRISFCDFTMEIYQDIEQSTVFLTPVGIREFGKNNYRNPAIDWRKTNRKLSFCKAPENVYLLALNVIPMYNNYKIKLD